MKKQPIEQFISLDNGWTLALSKGYQVFRNEHEVILLDVDYDTMGAFVFEEDGVIVKKTGWQVEPKIHFDQKQITVQMPLEEDEEDDE